MGKNTKYIAQVGLAEILELAMSPSATRVSAKRDFLGKVQEDVQAGLKVTTTVAPQ